MTIGWNRESANSLHPETASIKTSQTESSGGLQNSSWPMQSHDNLHTGRCPYSTASNPGAEIWRFRCGTVDGGPVIAEDGTIYFGDKDCYMYAVYPNGTLKWQYKLDDWIWSEPAIAENGTIYIGSEKGSLYAFNPNGSLCWVYHIIDEAPAIASSPAIAPDGTIYFGVMAGWNKGYIYALNPNGTLKWRYLTGYYITSDPAIGPDGTIYIGSGDTYLYAMNPDGTLEWRFKTGDYIKGPPSVAEDGTVYIGSFDDYLYALYPNNGTMKWQCHIGVGTETNPSITMNGIIYVGNDKLYAIYPNGTIQWEFNLGLREYITQSCPAISADGTIYVGTCINQTYAGDIIAVNPDGTERWRKQIANVCVRSSPAIASDGTVYIGSASENSTTSYGYLHAFGQGPLEQVEIYGPYLGMPNTPVQFKCNVRGGVLPYSFLWSFGDGGTATTKSPTHTYTQSGVYNVTLLVTDAEGNFTSNATFAIISAPPETPVISGPPKGKVRHMYNYTFVTTDPEGDDVEYYIDWAGYGGEWYGPYASGETVTLSHSWERGTYTIRCKARDIYGWESGWGTLKVTMPLSYEPPHFRFLDWLFERFPNAFPILRHFFEK